MQAQDFLVELGTEELPPKALKKLAEAFLAGVEGGLKDAGLGYAKARYYAAPRRLAVLVEALATQQPDRTTQLDGPPVQAAFDADGNPTKAAEGFARKCGVSLDEIDQSGPKLRFVQNIPGQPATDLLPGIVDAALAALPIPKRMRWGARKTEFVRPTQWLVMLLGDQVVPCEILSQRAGNLSRGHRFHHPDQVTIASPAAYAETLRSAHVIADFAERREIIKSRVDTLAAEQQGTAIVPADLLDEVTALVEWPVPLVCSFEERFLEVPQEALISTMQDNQKYFCLLDANGKLLPRFITVSNLESKDPAQIIAGNVATAEATRAPCPKPTARAALSHNIYNYWTIARRDEIPIQEGLSKAILFKPSYVVVEKFGHIKPEILLGEGSYSTIFENQLGLVAKLSKLE